MSLMPSLIPVSPLLASGKPSSVLLLCMLHSNPGSFTSLTVCSSLWHWWCELSQMVVKPCYCSIMPGKICKIMVGSRLYRGLRVLIYLLHNSSLTFDGCRAKIGDIHLEISEEFISSTTGLAATGQRWFKNSKVEEVPWPLLFLS
jgi:hypothetical protein